MARSRTTAEGWEQVTVYLPPDIWRQLRVQAIGSGTSASRLLVELVQEALAARERRSGTIAARRKRSELPAGPAGGRPDPE